MSNSKKISTKEQADLLSILELRFAKNRNRHKGIEWSLIVEKIKGNIDILWSLNEMEKTGGEPDIIIFKQGKDDYYFCDCSAESPAGRRSLCYDKEALDARKENKPINSCMQMAETMGIEILTEEEYRFLQTLGKFDSKTSSWLATPAPIRKLGGAIFADFRYGHIFVYHNGVQSYYAGRAFRGKLKI